MLTVSKRVEGSILSQPGDFKMIDTAAMVCVYQVRVQFDVCVAWNLHRAERFRGTVIKHTKGMFVWYPGCAVALNDATMLPHLHPSIQTSLDVRVFPVVSLEWITLILSLVTSRYYGRILQVWQCPWRCFWHVNAASFKVLSMNRRNEGSCNNFVKAKVELCSSPLMQRIFANEYQIRHW